MLTLEEAIDDDDEPTPPPLPPIPPGKSSSFVELLLSRLLAPPSSNELLVAAAPPPVGILDRLVFDELPLLLDVHDVNDVFSVAGLALEPPGLEDEPPRVGFTRK